MSALKYVCLSDLHLGADYSVLTAMDAGGGTTLKQPSDTLQALGAALRRYLPLLSGPEPPTLILLGDTLDLGLSPMGSVAQAFRRFLETLFPAGGPALFSNQVICLPGNHDHHLWRAAQDEFFIDTLDENIRLGPIPDLMRATPLFAQRTARCNLMTRLMRGYPHLADATVNVAYPNFGLIKQDRKRAVILHHGHYVDSVYRAMSTLNAALRRSTDKPATVQQIEQENGAWVDFLWSGLGDGGEVGQDTIALYETMRNALASHKFSQKLGDSLLASLAKGLGIGPETAIKYGVTVGNVVKSLIDLTLVRSSESDRDGYATVMSPESIADLRWYLGGPTLTQFRATFSKIGSQNTGDPAEYDLSFVFGHTHKPFQDQLDIEGHVRPVAVYNTGGWVMDQPTMTPAQGAAAIFIDDELNVASLRLFDDPLNGECIPVQARGTGGMRDRDNPLLASMTAAIAATSADWDAFSACARDALELHASVLLNGHTGPEATR
jgi:hypothetical protein